MAWDPAQYLKFAGPRLRPAIDLLGHIEAEAPRLVYDLGCGAGNVTRFIAERWPAARIVGILKMVSLDNLIQKRFCDATSSDCGDGRDGVYWPALA